eukprot:TRINITY_DN4384_c0_g1_i1.p1 TRINITY_DN4384_c0_g1~~TRINITY_DN4384_c0_g1_i1.p1  ORF type:complete len:381 (+),score=41.80 TRINITY_DN4384_c0_g1_i1:73-1215(+)
MATTATTPKGSQQKGGCCPEELPVCEKACQELVSGLRNNIRVLLCVGEGPEYEKASGNVARDLSIVRKMLVGDKTEIKGGLREMIVNQPDNEPTVTLVCPKSDNRLMAMLVISLRSQAFECRKDTEAVLIDVLSNSTKGVETFNHDLLQQLCEAYEWCNFGAVALNSGNILRQAIRHESILRKLLNHPKDTEITPAFFESSLFRRFFRYVNVVDFEVASDAFWTFKEALTKHPVIAEEYMTAHYTPFFGQYLKLLQPQQNYVTRRQSLKILGELLLRKSNFGVMTKVTQSTQHLKAVMILLRDTSAHIKFEAFHVFKLFVGNPNKTDEVKLILSMNKDKLLNFFSDPSETCTPGEAPSQSYQEELAFVRKQIAALPAYTR